MMRLASPKGWTVFSHLKQAEGVREILSIRTPVTWTASSKVPPEFCPIKNEAQGLNTAALGSCISSNQLSPCCFWGLNQFLGTLSFFSLFDLCYMREFAESLHSQVNSIRSGSRLKAEEVPMTKLEAN